MRTIVMDVPFLELVEDLPAEKRDRIEKEAFRAIKRKIASEAANKSYYKMVSPIRSKFLTEEKEIPEFVLPLSTPHTVMRFEVDVEKYEKKI